MLHLGSLHEPEAESAFYPNSGMSLEDEIFTQMEVSSMYQQANLLYFTLNLFITKHRQTRKQKHNKAAQDNRNQRIGWHHERPEVVFSARHHH